SVLCVAEVLRHAFRLPARRPNLPPAALLEMNLKTARDLPSFQDVTRFGAIHGGCFPIGRLGLRLSFPPKSCPPAIALPIDPLAPAYACQTRNTVERAAWPTIVLALALAVRPLGRRIPSVPTVSPERNHAAGWLPQGNDPSSFGDAASPGWGKTSWSPCSIVPTTITARATAAGSSCRSAAWDC